MTLHPVILQDIFLLFAHPLQTSSPFKKQSLLFAIIFASLLFRWDFTDEEEELSELDDKEDRNSGEDEDEVEDEDEDEDDIANRPCPFLIRKGTVARITQISTA